MDPAIWYLVVELMSSTVTPRSPPMVGPVTEQQCEQTRSAIGQLPEIVTARCRKMIGAMTCTIGGHPGGTEICPIFDDGHFVPLGSYR